MGLKLDRKPIKQSNPSLNPNLSLASTLSSPPTLLLHPSLLPRPPPPSRPCFLRCPGRRRPPAYASSSSSSATCSASASFATVQCTPPPPPLRLPPPPPLLPLDVPSSLAGAWRPHLADLHGGHQGWNSGHPFTADELAPPRGPPTPIGEAGPPRLELKRA